MSLIRFAARTMLASYFVVNGAKSITNPAPLVENAQPLVEKAVPTAKRLVGSNYASFVPENPKTLVRLNGVLQTLGGLGMATGIGRRFGAGLVAASMVPHVMASQPAPGASREQKKEARNDLMRNVALLGGALLASQDTAGKPGLMWRAANTTKRLNQAAKREAKRLNKDASREAKILGLQLSDMLPG